MLTKQETLLWWGAQAESRRIRRIRRAALPHGLGFTVMGLISRLSLANQSDSGSFLVAHTFSQDGCQ